MFGFRLKEPAKGDRITADWARELVKAIRSLRLQQGPGIRLSRTPEGTTISAVPSKAGGAERLDPNVAHKGEDDSSAAVEVVLDGSYATPDQTTWQYGDTDQATGKPTYPTVKSPRLYWDQSNHRLLCFRRSKTYNTSGCLVSVSAESAVNDSIVFTAVPEMP